MSIRDSLFMGCFLDRISTSSSYFRHERIKEQVYARWIMEKMMYNSLAVAIAVATGSGSAASGTGSTIYCTTYCAEGRKPERQFAHEIR
ncbi:MAG: hypothetical protein M3Y53_05480 [Thermoproteota archaeon]|nr:hypothetical protein [Thermoproteota archaeon]